MFEATIKDFQVLLAMNPLAAAQLEAIVWKRLFIAEKEANKQEPVPEPE